MLQIVLDPLAFLEPQQQTNQQERGQLARLSSKVTWLDPDSTTHGDIGSNQSQ